MASRSRTAACRIGALAFAAGLAAQEPTVPRPARLDLKKLLAEIDPGKQPPLSSLFPKWLGEWIEANTTDRDRARIAALDSRSASDFADWFGSLERVASPRRLGELAKTLSLLEAEHARSEGKNPETSRLLMGAYGFASHFSSTLVQARAAARQMLEATTAAEDRERIQEGIEVLERIIRPADLLLRHTAATVLANLTEPGVRISALRALAGASRFHGATELELALLEEAVSLEDGKTESAEWARLAEAYCAIFDVPRAKVAVARGKSLSRERSDRVLARIATLEEGLAALPKDELGALFERCHLWIEIGRAARAGRELTTLAAAHGGDSRLHTALAAVAHERFDAATVDKELALAAKLEPKDLRYHELVLRVGHWGAFLVAGQAARSGKDEKVVRKELGDALRGLAEHGKEATKGRSARTHLSEMLRQMILAGLEPEDLTVEQRIGVALSGREPELRRLARRWPKEEGFANLLRACALFTPKAVDSATTLADLGPSLRTAQAWVSHHAARGSADVLEHVRAALEGRDAAGPEASAVLADALALDATRSGDAATWKEAREAYERALAAGDHPRLRNNLGVVLTRLGQIDAAQSAFRAAAASDDAGLPALNARLARIGPETGAEPLLTELLSWLDAPEAEERDPHERPNELAAAWLVVLAERASKPDKATAFAKRAIEHVPQPVPPYEVPFARHGAVLERQALWNDATQDSGLRALTVGIRAEIWLSFPPPLTELELRRRALR